MAALNLLVNTIIQTYFYDSRCMFILSEPSANSFEYNGNISIVNVNIINTSIDEKIIFSGYGCQKFIIQHHDTGAVIIDIEQKMKLQGDRFNFRKYLILPSRQSPENSKILKLPIMQYIVDILLIIPDEESDTECESLFHISCSYNETFKLITHKYIGRSGNNDELLLDLWFSNNQSFLNDNNLYPDKITKQQGRILRCATFNYKPYSIIENSPPMAVGSENSVAHEYARRHNMTVEYTLDDDEWGIIYENWTGNGILGNLATDKADIGYGALYTWEHEYGFLDLSKPVVRTGITCLVPAPRLAAGWLTPFFPFSLQMWIGVAISFVVSVFVTASLTTFLLQPELQMKNRSERNKLSSKIDYREISGQSFLKIYRIFLIQSLPITSQEVDKALKYLFIIFLFSLLLTSSYSSGLASVMTIPRYEGAINTVWDLANSGMHWGATQDAWIFSIMDEQRPQYATLVQRFIPTSAENLMTFSKTNHFAFSIERLPSGQYAIGNYITESTVRKLRLLQEDLYWEYCVFMLRKSSPLSDSLDRIILELAQAGVIKFWEMKAAQVHMDLKVQNIVRYYATTGEEREGIVKLRWIHVEGTFGILAAGYIAATTCFILEKCFCTPKNKKLKRIRFKIEVY